jgi:polyisoprenyl-teichoic acid--peptidoglycan teichoic acid transferase
MEKVAQSRENRIIKERRGKWIFRFFISVLIILVGFGGYCAYSIFGAVSHGYKHAKKSQFRTNYVKIKKDPFAILLIGSDGRTLYGRDWRPDVIMLIVMNPRTKSIKLVSVPRDTYTEIANTNGFKTKINAAAYWGYQKGINPIQNILETTENLLHIPIDYYLKANFQGFTAAVDLLGGVDVNVKFPFSQQAIGGKLIFFKPGPVHLNGIETLAYVRMRKHDPNGDHGRNKRQQEVFSKIVDKLVSFEGMTKSLNIIETVGQNITYSIHLNEIPLLKQIYKESKNNLEIVKINTIPYKKKGIWYEILPEKERQRVSYILQQQLQFDPHLSPKSKSSKE